MKHTFWKKRRMQQKTPPAHKKSRFLAKLICFKTWEDAGITYLRVCIRYHVPKYRRTAETTNHPV